DGGVWRTRNAGVTWEPLFDGQPIASVGALAVAPSDANVIYVGTGEASLRSDITYGAGVYKSTDGGAHWQSLGLADTRHIGKIVVDPRNPDVVLVAALGHAYGPNAERGVFRSADGGRTWTKVLYKNPDTGAIDLAVDPGDARGLYRSDDRGATWQLAGTDPRITSRNWYFCRVTVDPQDPDVVYVPNVALLKSTDGGKTFGVLKGQPGGDDYHEVWVDPTSPTHVIV